MLNSWCNQTRGIQIIHDYYHAIEENNTPEISSSTTVELFFEREDIPAVESVPEGADRTQIENYNFPRLESCWLWQSSIKLSPTLLKSYLEVQLETKKLPKLQLLRKTQSLRQR